MLQAGSARRARWGWWALVLAVLGLHALVLGELRSALAPQLVSTMRRLETVYTRQVQVSAQPVRAVAAAPAPARRSRPAAPSPSSPAASQAAPVVAAEPAPPAAAASDPLLPVEPPLGLARVAPPEAAASASLQAAVAGSAPAAASAPLAAASAPAFEWPASTRIRYRLTGWYRGDISGVAQVEWLRVGDRYQVHLDVDAGVVARRMSSEGRVTAVGLEPQRYEESTKVVLTQPRIRQMRFDEHAVVLASGETVPRPGVAGELQDTASQFIQMIYVFSTRPDLLHPGGAMAIQLALPHRVRPYVYEVGALEWTESPGGGWLETWPVRPRVQGAPGAGSDLSVEVWLAPRLQMLPVRMRIRQGAESYLDLHIDRLPEQAVAR